jgi:molybdopterin converting factor small subunit
VSESESAPDGEMIGDLIASLEKHLTRLSEAVRWHDTAIGRAPSPNQLVNAGWAYGKGLTELEISGQALTMDPAFLSATIRAATGEAQRDLLRQAGDVVADVRREAEELLERLDAVLLADLPDEGRATLYDTRDWWRGYVESLHKMDDNLRYMNGD